VAELIVAEFGSRAHYVDMLVECVYFYCAAPLLA